MGQQSLKRKLGSMTPLRIQSCPWLNAMWLILLLSQNILSEINRALMTNIISPRCSQKNAYCHSPTKANEIASASPAYPVHVVGSVPRDRPEKTRRGWKKKRIDIPSKRGDPKKKEKGSCWGGKHHPYMRTDGLEWMSGHAPSGHSTVA